MPKSCSIIVQEARVLVEAAKAAQHLAALDPVRARAHILVARELAVVDQPVDEIHRAKFAPSARR